MLKGQTFPSAMKQKECHQLIPSTHLRRKLEHMNFGAYKRRSYLYSLLFSKNKNLALYLQSGTKVDGV